MDSWEIDGKIVSGFIFGGSKITADGDYSHEIKRCFLLGRKAVTNLDSIKAETSFCQQRSIVKAMVFTVVMWSSLMDVRVGP